MAQIIGRLARQRIRAPQEEIALPIGVRTLRLGPDAVELAQKTALEANLPLNDAKSVFSEILLREVRSQLTERGAGPTELATAVPAVRSSGEFRKALDKHWPSLSGAQLVRSLLGSPTNRKRAVGDLLSSEEAALLQRPSAKKIGDEQWTEADLALLDEANALTSGVGRRYGHVVIDEAQDLSAMALRAAGRRATDGSLTILGDIAQATGVAAQPSWEAVADSLGIAVDSLRTCELTVGYRVPGPILDFANRLLPVTAPSITPSSSIRERGTGVEMFEVDRAQIAVTVRDAATTLAESWSSIGIVVPDPLRDEVLAALTETDLDVGDTRRAMALDHVVSVVDPPTAKGLEFDATVVVEPAAFADEPNGLRLLYVALTRSVQELTIVASEALPAPLA